MARISTLKVSRTLPTHIALEGFGKRDGNRVVITLSLDGKNGRRNTEKVLGLLGIKLRTAQNGVELDRGEKKAQAKKQETVSALALDEVGMEEAFRPGNRIHLRFL